MTIKEKVIPGAIRCVDKMPTTLSPGEYIRRVEVEIEAKPKRRFLIEATELEMHHLTSVLGATTSDEVADRAVKCAI